MAIVCPLFSGSSGNSWYIGSKTSGILIDAGKSARQLTRTLQSCGIDPLAVQAVFVTHEHSDHITALRVFASKYQVPVYASPGTVAALESCGACDGSYICDEISTAPFSCGDLTVIPFHTSHDCAESYGYRVELPDGRSFSYATDLGFLSSEVKEMLTGSDFVVIESNHDIQMLKSGPYPYPLKRRILSDRGHLSNRDCAEFLPYLLRNGTKRFMLAHLSAENNTPQTAYLESLNSLSQGGMRKDIDFQLFVAPRENIACQSIVY